MKILLVNDYSERIGGTEVYVEELARNLRSAGCEVRCYFGTDDYKKSLNQRNHPTQFLKRLFNIFHLNTFKKVLVEFKPDVVHLQNIFNELSPLILLHLRDIPTVMTLHDYSIIQAVSSPTLRTGKPCKREMCPGCPNCVGWKGTAYEFLKRRLHNLLLTRVDAFIAPSKYMQMMVKENSNFRPVQIYNGFHQLDRKMTAFNYTALYAGRLAHEKGVQYLIEAVPDIIAKLPNFKLIIAGTGELESFLIKRAKELKVSKNVEFVGGLSAYELEKQYKRSSTVIVPSIWNENLPTVCIESLMYGIPVVATNTGGIPEIIVNNENGLLIEKRNSTAISKAVIEIFSDKENYLRMSNTAKKISSKFDIKNHLQRLIALYNEPNKSIA
jgi:glycosyltransferase involved in cell wall biosynthesis